MHDRPPERRTIAGTAGQTGSEGSCRCSRTRPGFFLSFPKRSWIGLGSSPERRGASGERGEESAKRAGPRASTGKSLSFAGPQIVTGAVGPMPSLDALREQGQMTWSRHGDGWNGTPEEILRALGADGFQECKREMTTSRRDCRPVGGVWQGVNPQTNSVASLIWVAR